MEEPGYNAVSSSGIPDGPVSEMTTSIFCKHWKPLFPLGEIHYSSPNFYMQPSPPTLGNLGYL